MSAIAVDCGRVAGMNAAELAARFGTPLYVYDLDAVEARVEALRGALPPSFELAYAAKANPAAGVLELMCGVGLGLDIASGGELRAALRAGFDEERADLVGRRDRHADRGFEPVCARRCRPLRRRRLGRRAGSGDA